MRTTGPKQSNPNCTQTPSWKYSLAKIFCKFKKYLSIPDVYKYSLGKFVQARQYLHIESNGRDHTYQWYPSVLHFYTLISAFCRCWITDTPLKYAFSTFLGAAIIFCSIHNFIRTHIDTSWTKLTSPNTRNSYWFGEPHSNSYFLSNVPHKQLFILFVLLQLFQTTFENMRNCPPTFLTLCSDNITRSEN